MKITLLAVGKTEDKYLIEGIEKYLGRLKHYIGFNLVVIPELKNTKNLTEGQQKTKEAEFILKQLSNTDSVILLDEKGKKYTSVQFANYLNKQMIGSVQHIVFIIGGPYGFDEEDECRADDGRNGPAPAGHGTGYGSDGRGNAADEYG